MLIIFLAEKEAAGQTSLRNTGLDTSKNHSLVVIALDSYINNTSYSITVQYWQLPMHTYYISTVL